MVRRVLFDAIDPSSNPPFAELFFSLFKSHIASERRLFKKKNEGNNQKVENKVSGRCREGFIVPIMWHPFNYLN